MDRIAPMIESFHVFLGADSPSTTSGASWVKDLRENGGSYSDDTIGHRVVSAPNTSSGRFLFEQAVRLYPPETADVVLIHQDENAGVTVVPYVRHGAIMTDIHTILERHALSQLSQCEGFDRVQDVFAWIMVQPLTLRVALLAHVEREARQSLKGIKEINVK